MGLKSEKDLKDGKMKEFYSKEVMKHFKHPKNVGSIKDADGIGKVGNILCGDVMWLFIKVKKEKAIITDAKFQTFGCVVAIANSSMLTEMVKGKTLEEALKINKEKLLKKLGKIPPIKIHCSVLAIDALAEAVYDYYKKNKIPIPKELETRHKRIIQTLKEIEKRHKAYVEFEKKQIQK